MKKLLMLFVVLIFAVPVFAQNVQKDVDAIKKMEQEITDDFLKGKADANDKYVHQNARVTTPDAQRQSRDAISISVRNGSLKFTQSVISDLHVLVFNDTAIATYDTDDKGTFNGMKIDGKNRWTDTWARIDGKWTCIATAGTPIPETTMTMPMPKPKSE